MISDLFSLLKSKTIFFILLMALLLRLISINQSFWLDEATSGYVTRDLSFSEILNKFSPGDFHPPLYYLLLKLWGEIFGFSEVHLRLFSVLVGTFTIFLVYLISRELEIKNKYLPTISALLLATSGLHIYYSQEARMYALSAFLVSLLIYLYLKIYKSNSYFYWMAFGTLLACNFLTDYLPNLIIPVFWIHAYLSKKDKLWWRKFLTTHLPLIIVFIWWLPYLSQQLNLGLSVEDNQFLWWQVLGKTDIKETLLVIVKFVIGRVSFDNKVFYALASILTTFVVWGLALRGITKENKKVFLIVMWFLVPLLLTWFLGFKLSIFSYFRLLFILPAFWILVALGVDKINADKIIFIVLTINILSSTYYLLSPKFHREDWRGAISFIKDQNVESYAVLTSSNSQTEAIKYYQLDNHLLSVDKLNNNYKAIWLFRYVQEVFDPDDTTRLKIENLGYEKTNEYDFNGIVVWKYKNENSN